MRSIICPVLCPLSPCRKQILQRNFAISSAITSHCNHGITQRTAREILHEEHKDCKKYMGNLHLTCTHGGLKSLFLGKVSKKQIQGHIQASSQSPLKKEQAPCLSLSISAFAIIVEIK